MEQIKRDTLTLADRLNRDFAGLDLAGRIARVGGLAYRAVFITSLGMEDQVLSWAIAMSGQSIKLATLKTGRLFPETQSLLQITRDLYGIDIKEYEPKSESLADYVERHGLDGFYNSIEARKDCCKTRKLEPLAEALKGADVWITGLRRSQSQQRSHVDFAEWDAERGLLKINPLADWSGDQVKAAIAAHEIPVNPIHARGYPSIGCEPCTRAIKPGEDERAGRWW